MTREEKLALIPEEFLDIALVLEMGAQKHGRDSWLEPGIFSTKRFDSAFHHLAKSYAGVEIDVDSGLENDLLAACNNLMFYTLKKRGIYKSTPKLGDDNGE